VDPAQVVDIGSANGNRWQLVPGTAWDGACHAERAGASADPD